MINRECPKCGDDKARVTYDRTFEAMEMNCNLCGYHWQMKPLDAIRADKERSIAKAVAK